MIRYRIYPTLLDAFARYHHQVQRPDGSLYVDFQEIIDKINRVPVPRTAAQQRGVSFETALLTGEGEEQFPAGILQQMRQQLPARYRTQVFVRTVVQENIELYGFVDVLGGNRAIDIKTTAHYKGPGQYAGNFQNLYLLALRAWGIQTLEYLITDFSGVHSETYAADTYDFAPLLADLQSFIVFLEANRKLIRDRKIMAPPEQLRLF